VKAATKRIRVTLTDEQLASVVDAVHMGQAVERLWLTLLGTGLAALDDGYAIPESQAKVIKRAHLGRGGVGRLDWNGSGITTFAG